MKKNKGWRGLYGTIIVGVVVLYGCMCVYSPSVMAGECVSLISMYKDIPFKMDRFKDEEKANLFAAKHKGIVTFDRKNKYYDVIWHYQIEAPEGPYNCSSMEAS